MQIKPKKILITGGTGFLGSNLIMSLNNNYDIHLMVRNKSNINKFLTHNLNIKFYNYEQNGIENSIEQIDPDIIIHCATDYGRKECSDLDILETNIILPLKLLTKIRNKKKGIFINTDTYLDKGVNTYSLSKKQFRDWLINSADRMICINFVLEHFYGPNDNKTKFVSNIIEQLINEVEYINLTKGEQKRDFIYIDDVISAFRLVIDRTNNFKIGFYEFEIGTNKTISIKDLVEKVKKIVGNTNTDLRFGFLPYRENEVMDSHVNTDKIRTLGWRDRTSLDEGLARTINFELKKNK